MTRENINDQTYQPDTESTASAMAPELSPDQAAARAQIEMLQTIGQVALPTANFREAPAVTDSTTTEVPDELKAVQRNLQHAVPEIVTEVPEHLRPR